MVPVGIPGLLQGKELGRLIKEEWKVKEEEWKLWIDKALEGAAGKAHRFAKI